MRRHLTTVALTTLTLLAVSVPATAHATTPTVKNPITATATIGFDAVRIDKQDDAIVIPVLGVNNKAPITVNWGDGTGNETSRVKCAPKKAAQHPDRCSLLLRHYYDQTGTYTIVVNSAATTIASKPITIAPIPAPWAPPEGWTQPAGWAVFNGGATFIPCSTVQWYFDRAGEPGDRTTAIDDVRLAFNLLAPETGLTFVETTDPAAAQIVFDWKDLTPVGANVAGYGGGNPYSHTGSVDLSNNNEWTKNDWAGANTVTKEWDADGYHWTWQLAGRAWLIVHELGHVLGLGHVPDNNQVMASGSQVTTFGSGDLDGLHTEYLNNPCPVVP